jgi:hypothetical protein
MESQTIDISVFPNTELMFSWMFRASRPSPCQTEVPPMDNSPFGRDTLALNKELPGVRARTPARANSARIKILNLDSGIQIIRCRAAVRGSDERSKNDPAGRNINFIVVAGHSILERTLRSGF